MIGRAFEPGAVARLAAAGLVAILAGCVSPGTSDLKSAPYKNPSLPVERRVDDLVRRMTLDEKIAQITTVLEQRSQLLDEHGAVDPARASKAFPAGIGQIAHASLQRPAPDDGGGPGATAKFGAATRSAAEFVNDVQHWAVEDTRLGIPVLFHEEALHGLATRDATAFPEAIGLASTWDPDLLTDVFSVAGRETAARGVRLVLAPVVDVGRDPRWGRTEETYGEDPYLVGELSVAAVRGFQGDVLPLTEGHVFATLKHFTGHGQPEAGENVGPAPISERQLREIFFPPFEQVVTRTHVMSVMPSYNEIDGVPSHANTWLLGKVLRGEWGFKGAAVSDYWGVRQLAELHHVEPDPVHAAARALEAGVDSDQPNGDSYSHLPEALKAGLIKEADIDRAVRRMLTLKFDAGLFEHPYADADAAVTLTNNAEAQALALRAARETIVLLKNDGVLPLDRKRLHRLAVIGPNAAARRLGGYSGAPPHVVTVLDGIRNAVGKNVHVVYAEGVKITEGDQPELGLPGPPGPPGPAKLADRKTNLARIRKAARTARSADAIVLVVGENEITSREAWSGHLGDRSDIALVGEQGELARAMFALGKPVVTVLINGKPLGVPEVAEKTNALVEGWYLGQEGGTAMAEALFGRINPGGKLPVTMARSVGQLPLTYNEKPSAHRGYIFGTTEPLYPFGWGLSYTTFEIGAPRLSESSIPVKQLTSDGAASSTSAAKARRVQVSVDVTNTGKRAGDEVVQLYIRDLVSSVTRPVKELRGFRRITLEPGETRTVTFALGEKDLRFWNKDMKRVVEPGEFAIMVGGNSAELKTATLTVTK
jgi:beta-glucosidase